MITKNLIDSIDYDFEDTDVKEALKTCRALLAWREKVHNDKWSSSARLIVDSCIEGKGPEA